MNKISTTLVVMALTLSISTLEIAPVLGQSTDITEQINTNQNSELDDSAIPSPEEDTSVPTDPYTLEVVVGTQSPWTKAVPVTVKARPNIDTTRTNFTWDTALGLEADDPKASEYAKVPAGVVYSRTVYLKPINPGTYTIAVTATDWGYGKNVASTVSFDLTFGENLITQPQTDGYFMSVIIRYIVIALVLAIIGGAIYVFGKIGLVKLKKWLQPPEF